jgi:myo-inositol 2-dehydrogenase / D-chiro-inositol 1-dehydrogenase
MKQEQKNPNPSSDNVSRRDFLKNSSLAVAGSVAALSFPAVVHAQEKAAINAVVIGMGGRGGGAGGDFLNACKEVGIDGKIVAVADIFPNQSNRGMNAFGLPQERCFSGFDSYMKALEVPGVNYAILAAPPGFRPPHFKACIDMGKHVFMEKPVAVDSPGCKVMYDAYQKSKEKNLKVAAGTQRRHQFSYMETIKRLQDGAVGDVITLRAYWVNGGPIWHRGLKGETDLERQIHNWYHYLWLSGDHICEQHVHNLDVCNWIMNDHPVRCWGMGARQQLGEKAGEIWDNFAVEYEYRNGVRMYSYCGQIKREWSSVSEGVHGTKGTSNAANWIQAQGERWRYQGKGNNPYVQEHVHLIQAIVKNTELNETKNVTDSTLTAIMGREAAFSGRQVEWDAIQASTFKYGPDELYTEAYKLKFGPFRTLTPPMPSLHDVLSATPKVVGA